MLWTLNENDDGMCTVHLFLHLFIHSKLMTLYVQDALAIQRGKSEGMKFFNAWAKITLALIIDISICL